MHLKIRIDTTIASTSTQTSILNSQKLRTEQMSKNSKNPLIKIVVKKSMKQIASNSNVENTQAWTKTA